MVKRKNPCRLPDGTLSARSNVAYEVLEQILNDEVLNSAASSEKWEEAIDRYLDRQVADGRMVIIVKDILKDVSENFAKLLESDEDVYDTAEDEDPKKETEKVQKFDMAKEDTREEKASKVKSEERREELQFKAFEGLVKRIEGLEAIGEKKKGKENTFLGNVAPRIKSFEKPKAEDMYDKIHKVSTFMSSVGGFVRKTTSDGRKDWIETKAKVNRLFEEWLEADRTEYEYQVSKGGEVGKFVSEEVPSEQVALFERICPIVKEALPELIVERVERSADHDGYTEFLLLMFTLRTEYDIIDRDQLKKLRLEVSSPRIRMEYLMADIQKFWTSFEMISALCGYSREEEDGESSVEGETKREDGDSTVSKSVSRMQPMVDEILIDGMVKIVETVSGIVSGVHAIRLTQAAERARAFDYKPDAKEMHKLHATVCSIVIKAGVVGKAKDNEDRPGTERKKPRCLAFEKGRCHRGDSCKYSHDLKSNSADAAGELDDKGEDVDKDFEANVTDRERFTTKGKCKEWISKGKCTRTGCTFQHDEKWKGCTMHKYCYNMANKGECEFGDRCVYSHDERDKREGKGKGKGKGEQNRPSNTADEEKAGCEIDFSKMDKEQIQELAARVMEEVDRVAAATIADAPQITLTALDETNVVACVSKEHDSVVVWMIDGGANVVTLGQRDDLCIQKFTGEMVMLGTSQGRVEAEVVVANTPFGLKKGVYSPGAPRILPEADVCDHGKYVRDDKGFEVFIKNRIPYMVQRNSEVAVACAFLGNADGITDGGLVACASTGVRDPVDRDFQWAVAGLVGIVSPVIVAELPEIQTRRLDQGVGGEGIVTIDSRPGEAGDVAAQLKIFDGTKRVLDALFASGMSLAALTRKLNVTLQSTNKVKSGDSSGSAWLQVMHEFNGITSRLTRMTSVAKSESEGSTALEDMIIAAEMSDTVSNKDDDLFFDANGQSEEVLSNGAIADGVGTLECVRAGRPVRNRWLGWFVAAASVVSIAQGARDDVGNDYTSAFGIDGFGRVSGLVYRALTHLPERKRSDEVSMLGGKALSAVGQLVGVSDSCLSVVHGALDPLDGVLACVSKDRSVVAWNADVHGGDEDDCDNVKIVRAVRTVPFDSTCHDWVVPAVDAAVEKLSAANRLEHLVVDTSADYAAAHALKGHKPYDGRCSICVSGKMRSRKHCRVGEQVSGQLSIDLVQLNQGDAFYAVGVVRSPRLIAARKVDSKSAACLSEAIVRLILELERVWGAGVTVRVHSDSEKGILSADLDVKAFAQKGIAFTRTAGLEHQSNGAAETAIRTICGDARVLICHLSDRSTRRVLFEYALRNASDRENARQTEGSRVALLKESDLAPFGSLCYVRLHPAQKLNHLDDRGRRAIYLCPDKVVSNGSVVGLLKAPPVDSLGIEGIVAATLVRRVGTNGFPVVPDVVMRVAASRNHFAGVVLVPCTLCGKRRPVSHKHTKRLQEGGLVCDRLLGVSCDLSEENVGLETICELRRGRARKVVAAVAHVSEVVAPTSDSSLQPSVLVDELHAVDVGSDDVVSPDELVDDFDRAFVDRVSPDVWSCVTRACTRQERASAGSMAARQAEVDKLVSLGAIGWPCEAATVRAGAVERSQKGCAGVDAVSQFAMLDHIMFAEMAASEWEFKRRGVVLGHRLWKVLGGKLLVDRRDLWAPVSSLAGVRVIFCAALVGSWRVLNYDVLNAYLNIRYPSETYGEHWLRLGPDVVHLLPSAMRSAAEGMVEAWFPMERAVYGHPLTGFLFIQESLATLVRNGFVRSDFDPAVCTKGSCICACYVDDNSVTGTDDDLRNFEAILGARFPIGAIDENTRILGQNPRFHSSGEVSVLQIGMQDYLLGIVRLYEEQFNCKVYPRKVAATLEVRGEAIGDLDERDFVKKTIRSLLQMPLWLGRCGRPDVLSAVTGLRSRINTWDRECSDQVGVLMGYLLGSKGGSLCLRVVHDDVVNNILRCVLCTDSNWMVPRSVSGWCLGAQGDSGGWLAVSFGSRGQTLCADSSTAAGPLGCVTGLKEALVTGRFLHEVVCKQPVSDPTPVLVDNYGLLRLTIRGVSSNLVLVAKALALRQSLLKDIAECGLASFRYTPSASNLARISLPRC